LEGRTALGSPNRNFAWAGFSPGSGGVEPWAVIRLTFVLAISG